jgi:hypothetical protein
MQMCGGAHVARGMNLAGNCELTYRGVQVVLYDLFVGAR